ncbi:MAG: ribokinase, partial [Aliifodinibius sp.]|nr:ribokinase [Fodinibius sp.]NIY28138.1 ribokinase [Fodinibius sp.]
MITIDSSGQNEIVVASGSNMNLLPADIEAKRDLFARAGLLLLQLEIPLETVLQSIKIAGEFDLPIILNPAPAQPLP